MIINFSKVYIVKGNEKDSELIQEIESQVVRS